ncbi:MAG: flagellar hook-associated protein FlgK [Hyphomicrobiales bacterium]
MGLGQSVQNALGGLRATQKGIEVSSRNVANANTEGYTKKSVSLSNNVIAERAFGVNVGAVTRQVDRFLQSKVHGEYADFNKLSVQSQFLDYVDNLFGRPGDDGSLDSIVNNVSTALSDFANAPQTGATRQQVIENANYLASHLRDMSGQIQEMRQNTEHMIAQEVQLANDAMLNIASLNHQLALQNANQPDGRADLQDKLDNYVDDLAAIFDIKTVEGTNGTVKVFTQGGILLVDQQANHLTFDERANLGPEHLYSTDNTKRNVGTITLSYGAASGIDLIQQGATRSGKISGLLELRDVVLTNAQDQLDELAHGLAQSFNIKAVEGDAVTAGANAGFKLDLSGLANGNVAEFSYKDNLTGATKTISFVRMADSSNLPLSDNMTATGGDKVFGIDFSGTMASVEAQIEAAITSESPYFNVSLVGGTEVQIVDDGALNNVDVLGFNAKQTVAGTQGEGGALNFFTDLTNTGETNYTNNLENGGQKRGYASRIRMNSVLVNDNTLLVKDEASTGIGSQVRPFDLLSRFTETTFSFNADSGIGTQNSPFKGTMDDFTRQVVANQTSRAGTHQGKLDNQELILSALNSRMEGMTKVNVDEEMANLLVLQTSYAANARIVSVVKELMDMLMHM